MGVCDGGGRPRAASRGGPRVVLRSIPILALGVLLLAPTLGCGHRPGPGSGPGSVRRPAVETPPATVVAAPRPRPPQLRPIRSGSARLVRESADGVHEVVVGGTRARVTSRRRGEPLVRTAADAFSTSIVGTARDDDGWWFVSERGLVARAPTFLGTLEVVGTTTPPAAASWNEPRLWILPADGGEPRLRDARGWTALPASLPIVDVAFETASFGAAILEGGGLLITEDGGRRFVPLSLPDDRPALGLRAEPEGVVALDGHGNAFRVHRDHVVADGRRGRERSSIGWLRRRLIPELPETFYEQVTRLATPTRAEPVTPSGHVATRGPTGLYVLEAATGHRVAVTHPSSRAVRVFGDRLLAIDQGGWVELWPDTGRAHPRLPPRQSISLALDGTAAMWIDDEGDDGPRLAILDADGHVERVGLPEVTGRLVGLSALDGGVATVGVERESVESLWVPRPEQRTRDFMTGSVFVRSPATGAWTELCPGRAPFDRVERVNGSALVFARGRTLAVGGPDRCPELWPLPDGAHLGGFRSSTDGVAVGQRLGSLAFTDDGGRTWQPMEVPDPTIYLMTHSPLVCSTLGCDLFTSEGWLAVRWSRRRGRLLAGPPPAPPSAQPDDPDVDGLHLDCRFDGPTSPRDARRVLGPVEATQQTVADDEGWTARLTWSAAGRQIRSGPTRLAFAYDSDETPHPCASADGAPLVVHAAVASGALVECGVLGRGSATCSCDERYYWFSSGGPGRPVELPHELGSAVSDGSTAYVLARDRAPPEQAVLVVDSRGPRVLRRYVTRAAALSLAGGDAPALILRTARGAWRQPFGGSRAAASPVEPLGGGWRPCGAQDVTPTLSESSGVLPFADGDAPVPGFGSMQSRATSEGRCVAHVFARAHGALGWIELQPASDASLRGSHWNPDNVRPVRCHFRDDEAVP